ncbi:UDP-N-acetylmuramate--L-alanine ligase [Luteolibacter pohnpeiensis]|uniref:Multifunctional fusion protein n=1 Tax=Luteolibacter pohnpeiensis TaxID=454153 RepID=A0A934S8E6_9BACT|nr:UDP-N-acetylmuramate--L-alanine ligase [Luteolibacter pohnpeiensis]MBK1883139.1 UDP-N-acetylmuramate--L-alanine ligase [Luteolibacter pohnpeiensis]
MTDLSQRLTDRKTPLNIHLIGVAGSGMSGLALLLMGMGHHVSGSDKVTTAETDRMQGLGLVFSSPPSAAGVKGAELVVYSSAIKPDNPAFAAAKKAKIPLICRAECLAAILHTKKGIVISGTHGKTTTSAMTSHLLREADQKPCHYVGAEIPILGSNAKWSEEGVHMVAEGDESDGTLALYHPEHAVILNIEAEHLDFYRDIDHIKEVFTKLADQTTGKIVYCAEDPVAGEICEGRENAISYGWDDADYTASDIRELKGSSAFTVMKNGEPLGDVELGIPGNHNILNALAAIAIADCCGAEFTLIARALATFAGAKRRFETKYLSPKYRIVDDYGHHPTEIAATLQTARSLKPSRVVVLFQPHRYTRTQALAEDFGKVLQEADLVFITDVYPASEAPIPGISGQTLVDAVERNGDIRVVSVPDLATAHHTVGNALETGDLLITLGAGNVHEAGHRIAGDLKILEEMEALMPEGEIEGRLYEPMKKHTTMLVGGPAQYWIEPHSFYGFAFLVDYCRGRGIPVRVVGRGSNLLVRDGGIRGAVIHPTGGAFSEVTIDGKGMVTAGAGVRLKKLASVAGGHGIGGFEWMEGIPGNVGGALRMNAGAMGVETFDQVVRVTFLDEDGVIRTREREEIVAKYRNVAELRRNFALQAVFKGKADKPENIKKRWEDSREKRKNSQPIAASAGCIFKNPEYIAAGRLVDSMGLKGTTHGNAAVSETHGNFIINQGGATATEVLELIDSIKAQAKEQRYVDLETEVKILGEEEPTF